MSERKETARKEEVFLLSKAALNRVDPGIRRLLSMKGDEIIKAKQNHEKRIALLSTKLKAAKKTEPSKPSEQQVKNELAPLIHPVFGSVYIERARGKRPLLKVRAIVNFNGNADDLRGMGIAVHSGTQNIFTITATRTQLATLASQAATQKIRLPRIFVPFLQNAVPTAEVDQIHAVGSQGNGVIAGIIDSTLHVRHNAFRLPTGQNNTRVKYMWVQEPDAGSPPGQTPQQYFQDTVNHPNSPDFTGFDYGIIYDEAAINAALQNKDAKGNPATYGTGTNQIAKQPSLTESEHGTHTTGILAGSGQVDNYLSGVNVGSAPLADIVHVCYRYANANVNDGTFESDILNALNFILRIADHDRQPVVISNSYGTSIGPHNGETDFDHARNAMLDSFLGRSIVYAAGNDNAIINTSTGAYIDEQGFRKDSVAASTTGTFTFDSRWSDGWLEIWYSGADLDIRIDHEGVSSAWNSPPNGFSPTLGTASLTVDREVQASTGLKRIGVFFTNLLSGGLTINLRNNNSSTSADYWTWAGLQGHWGYISGYSVDEMTLADTGCARAILSVGACAKQVGGNVEAIAPYSGRGPTLDGRIKPEITAVGGTYAVPVMSADSFTTGGYIGINGTSMAAPLVAGAIALLFENNPNLNQDTIKGLLTQTADRTNLNIDPLQASYDHKQRNAFGYGRLRMLASFQHSLPLVDVDVWVKTADDDFGFEPYPGDNFCQAPEVKILDKNNAETTALTWGEEYTVKIKVHNLGDTAAIKTKAQIKYTRPWAAPDNWAPCTDTGSTEITQEVNVAPLGDIELTFTQKWQPKQTEIPPADPDWGDHYCLLIEVDNKADPLTYEQSSVAGSEAWCNNIKGSNNIALRNLAIK